MTSPNEKNWFNQPLEPVDLNKLEYIPDPEPINTDLRITRIDKHVDDDDYITPLKKPEEEEEEEEEEDPLAKLDLAKIHSIIMVDYKSTDYETTYKTMDPFFEILFKPLDDPLFQPNPELEKLDELLSQMYYNSLQLN
jgi:hypothetical protein